MEADHDGTEQTSRNCMHDEEFEIENDLRTRQLIFFQKCLAFS